MTVNIEQWTRAAVAKYPVIEGVYLAGSRALGCEREDSDYDLVMFLEASCYDENNDQIDHIEQRIAFDPVVRFEKLDLFFYRPPFDGPYRWEFALGEQNPWPDPQKLSGLPGACPGDWDQLRKEFSRHAKGLFERGDFPKRRPNRTMAQPTKDLPDGIGI